MACRSKKAGDFSVVLGSARPFGESDGLCASSEDTEAVRLLNEAISNYQVAVEYELMKYKLTSDALAIALWDMDVVSGDPVNPNNKFAWSQEFRHMLGFSDTNDFPNILSSWSDLLHPDDNERTLNALTAHLNDRNGEIPYDVEYRLRLKNGSYRYFHAFGTTLRDGSGVPLRVAGALLDVTERKQVEEALKRREVMLSSLTDMAVTLLSYENESFDDVMSNGLKPVAQAAGIDRIAVYRLLDGTARLGQTYLWRGKTLPLDERLLILPDIPPVLRWLKTLTKGEYINADVSKMPDDESAFLSLYGVKSIFIVPIFTRGQFWGVITLEDHTAHRYFDEEFLDLMRSAAHLCAGTVVRAEMEREVADANVKLKDALEQATAASKAKGDFLSCMSHEMRTPMNAIIGMTAIGKKAEDIEQKNYALNRIEDASSHLLGVINDVLDMAKIEANKLELTPVEYVFEKMLRKVTTFINFRMDEKQLRFFVYVDDNIPRSIVGDDQRLAQVITNLLSNAVKFTPKGGDIRLEASLVGEAREVCELRVEVADNGIGISPERQDKLFAAFAQAESGTSRKYGGTGLGLFISKRIVELMGGRIWVESEPGKGSRFIFTVKARCCKAPPRLELVPSGADEVDPGEFEGKRLLIAEDIEINREILISLLEDTGIIIDCAENGKEALEMIEAAPEKYDIVLMDVQMPQMDGLEATHRIRALPALQRGTLPIIAMTANVFKDDVEACLEAGMDDHLGKPLDIGKVLEKLRQYLTAGLNPI